MSGIIGDNKFTAQHHALLFTSISKQAIHQLGKKKGEQILRKAVRRYGQQRGKRMALRAEKNGHALTVESYLAYGEWEVSKDEMNSKLTQIDSDARLNIFKCPWHTVWKENNLLEYGKYYCEEIDTALVHGFNPDLGIKIYSIQTNGDEHCDFIFRNSRHTFSKKLKPGSNTIMPWDYHTGHLFKTVGDVIKQEFGTAAEMIMENALTNFINFSSKEHIEIVKKYLNSNFDELPDHT